MASPVPAKSQPLHNFNLPELKWNTDGNSSGHHHRRRSIKSPSWRPNTSSPSPLRHSPLRDSVSETSPNRHSPAPVYSVRPSPIRGESFSSKPSFIRRESSSLIHGESSSLIHGESSSSKPYVIREWLQRQSPIDGDSERRHYSESEETSERGKGGPLIEYRRNHSKNLASDSPRFGGFDRLINSRRGAAEKAEKKTRAALEIDLAENKRSSKKILIKIPCKNKKPEEEANRQQEPPCKKNKREEVNRKEEPPCKKSKHEVNRKEERPCKKSRHEEENRKEEPRSKKIKEEENQNEESLCKKEANIKEGKVKIERDDRDGGTDDLVQEEGNIISSNNAMDDETKMWILRPRRPLRKSLNANGGGGACFVKNNRSPTLKMRKSQSPLRIVNNKSGENEENGEKKEKKRLTVKVVLTKREIEEDLFAFNGMKSSRRPKKRPKNVQKLVDAVLPGMWLVSITTDSYKVSEKSMKG